MDFNKTQKTVIRKCNELGVKYTAGGVFPDGITYQDALIIARFLAKKSWIGILREAWKAKRMTTIDELI